MRLTFVVTTFDIAPWVGQCLDSVRACARPGDAVVVVDDGSADGTAEAVEAALAAPGWAEGVHRQAVLIGANTPGGVGIPANIGMMHATGEALFFVDGDDWLEPAGFAAARAAFAAANAGEARADILIGNYREHDEAAGQARLPADAHRWAALPPPGDAEAARRLALSMVAVPWRKFYRRDFLVRHRLRFPEGRFFYEDNPFHWAVCLAARGIVFADTVLCRHRVNRPGQTMAATGAELLAFFDHYDRIRAGLPAGRDDLEGAALDWLLAQMSWHVGRLSHTAWWPWAARAAAALAAPSPAVWAAAAARHAGTRTVGIAAALRAGDVAGVVGVLAAEQAQRKLEAVENAVRRLDLGLAALRAETERALARIGGGVEALCRIAEFEALAALPAPPDPPLPPAPPPAAASPPADRPRRDRP